MEALVQLILGKGSGIQGIMIRWLWGIFQSLRTKHLHLWTATWFIGVFPAMAQPVFGPYAGPTHAFPGTSIGFVVGPLDCDGYDLLAAPPDVTSYTLMADRGGLSFAMAWTVPSDVAVGTTNSFVIRATNRETPVLSATQTVSIVLVDSPTIQRMILSNGAPVLQFNNPIIPTGNFGQWFQVLWNTDLTSTNWSVLCDVRTTSPLVTVTDTNNVICQRFYRVTTGGWFYGFPAP